MLPPSAQNHIKNGTCALLLSICAVTLIVITVALVPAGRPPLTILTPQTPEREQEAYWVHAKSELTKWQASLFSNMAAAYRTASCNASQGCRPGDPVEPSGHARFLLFKPIASCPPGMALRRWGFAGDGGKWLCGIESMKEGGIIVSVGSKGQFDFEESMLSRTPCVVHTYDCMYKGASIGPRHHYHKVCLGSAEKSREQRLFTTLTEIKAALGIDNVSLLKMDIESSEYDVMASWVPTDPLPFQISFELHYADVYRGNPLATYDPAFKNVMWMGRSVGLSEMAVFMLHLANLGYLVVSKEDNKMCDYCSEFTLIRVKQRQAKSEQEASY